MNKLTIAQYRKKTTESKYKNRETKIDGITFDSKAESEFYLYLKEIYPKNVFPDVEIKRQITYSILDDITDKKGKKHKGIKYIADFEICRNGKESTIVFDVKGVETDVFKIKRKLFLHRYPDKELRIIKKTPAKYKEQLGEWAEIEEIKLLEKREKTVEKSRLKKEIKK